MNIKTVAATLGAALSIAGSPVIASAATTVPSPIRLDSVEIAQSYGVFNDFFPGLTTVKFTNEAAKTVVGVTFALEAGGKVIDRINDVGTYPNGVTVKHSFPNIQTNYDQQLAVDTVTFADGSVWNNANVIGTVRQSAQNDAAAPTSESLFPYQYTN